MPQIRIKEAASFLGVSDDTLRRWIDRGQLSATSDDSGRLVVDGASLAELAVSAAHPANDPTRVARSARNRFVGLVTDIRKDAIMAQVSIQAGPHRVVSLLSTEAVEELALEVGSVAVAVVKSTSVLIEMSEGDA